MNISVEISNCTAVHFDPCMFERFGDNLSKMKAFLERNPNMYWKPKSFIGYGLSSTGCSILQVWSPKTVAPDIRVARDRCGESEYYRLKNFHRLIQQYSVVHKFKISLWPTQNLKVEEFVLFGPSEAMELYYHQKGTSDLQSKKNFFKFTTGARVDLRVETDPPISEQLFNLSVLTFSHSSSSWFEIMYFLSQSTKLEPQSLLPEQTMVKRQKDDFYLGLIPESEDAVLTVLQARTDKAERHLCNTLIKLTAPLLLFRITINRSTLCNKIHKFRYFSNFGHKFDTTLPPSCNENSCLSLVTFPLVEKTDYCIYMEAMMGAQDWSWDKSSVAGSPLFGPQTHHQLHSIFKLSFCTVQPISLF